MHDHYSTGLLILPCVRLVGGGSDGRSGRLEVYYSGQWGTVCDDSFDERDAVVACRELGYGPVGQVLNNRFGPGEGQIWLDDLQCTGEETSLATCPSNGWGVNDCEHSEDVSISCPIGDDVQAVPLPVSARLAGGTVRGEGRLEVNYRGQWGTVCDDNFDANDAIVACQMLGYGAVGSVLDNRYGPGQGQIWLDDLQCTGTETSLAACRSNGWGINDCEHSEDVSISCVAQPVPAVNVRLAGSAVLGEGRLEVFYNNAWGTVCDDAFDNNAAQAACTMLGYGGYGQFLYNQYGPGLGPIQLDQVTCTGSESSIVNCQHNAWGVHDCTHIEDVSISCNPTAIRLVNGSSPGEGRLEIYHSGEWGTVCDDDFDDNAATVVCYMLGYGRTGAMLNNQFGPGQGRIWLDQVTCTGTESSLDSCSHNVWGINDCTHYEDVSISCLRPIDSGPDS